MAEGGSKDERFVKRIDFSSANVAASWKAFKGQFKIFKVAKKFAEMTEEEQICNMLVQMGSDSVQIYEQFQFDEAVDAKKRTLENTVKFFDGYFEPVKNVIFERAKFNSMKQGEQSIHQFIVALQQQAAYCDYAGVKDELVRDRIVVGVRDQRLREYLIDQEDLDLQTCIQKAKQYTSNHGQATQFQETDRDNIDAIVGPRFESGKKLEKSKFSASSPCFFCGKLYHKGNRCPSKESKCRACLQKGHWAGSRACKGKSGAVKDKRQVMTLEAESSLEDTMEGLFLGSDQL